jgi:cell division protein FtsB
MELPELPDIWFCERKHQCKWQGFALNGGVAFGEIPTDTSDNSWFKWHEKECGGKLTQINAVIQPIIAAQRAEIEELKTQLSTARAEIAKENRPVVVCLCGSTRFKQDFINANFQETMLGKIVLTVGWFSHTDGSIFTPTPAQKVALDELHKRKIDLADEVLFLNVGGYMGDSTKSELNYAQTHSKVIRFIEPYLAPDKEGGTK